jgi:hypothetical protein
MRFNPAKNTPVVALTHEQTTPEAQATLGITRAARLLPSFAAGTMFADTNADGVWYTIRRNQRQAIRYFIAWELCAQDAQGRYIVPAIAA